MDDFKALARNASKAAVPDAVVVEWASENLSKATGSVAEKDGWGTRQVQVAINSGGNPMYRPERGVKQENGCAIFLVPPLI
jgi:hypothetical protein